MNDVLDKLDIPHDTDVPLGPLTWYGVGGTAACLARPRTVEQLAALAAHCHKTQAPLRVLGSGANLLVRNTTVPGVVVRLDAPGFAQLDMDTDTGRITAGGGYDLFKLVTTTATACLYVPYGHWPGYGTRLPRRRCQSCRCIPLRVVNSREQSHNMLL